MALSTKTIREVTETLIDYRGKTPTKTLSGVKLITAKVIKDGFIVDGHHEYIATDEYDSWMRRGLPRQWDILITTEAPLGEVAQLRTPEKVALAQRVILLRGNASVIDQNYYFHALKSPFVQAGLKARSTGTTVLGIKQSELWSVKIPCPSLNVQKRIAEILCAYDDLIENNNRRIKILEQMAQMLYREWFVNFRFPGHEKVNMVEAEMGLIPQGWGMESLKEVMAFIGRGISPTYDDAVAGLVINQKCIRDGKLNLSPARRQSKKVPEEKIGREGDILINSTGVGTLGRVAQIWEPILNCTVDSHVSIVRPRQHFEFFGRALLELEDHFTAQGVGSTGQTELSRERIGATQVLIPPVDMRVKFSEVVKPMHKMIVCCSKRNDVLRETRELLLPKLVSGEVSLEQIEKQGVAQTV